MINGGEDGMMDSGEESWSDLIEELNELSEMEEEPFDEDSVNYTAYQTSYKQDPETLLYKPDEEVVDTSELVGVGENQKKKEEEEELLKDITEEDIEENASLLYPEEKVYRSLCLEIFTPDQLIELEKLSRTFSISNNKKIEIIKERLTEWNIPWSSLGPGTNRYGFMTDGYVVKIACDKDGKVDNRREFKYSIPLYPACIKCYEVSEDGLVAVFEYVEVFNIDDFWQNQDEMRNILKDIASVYMIGDVGVSSKNYLNWGFRDDGSITILDYAYIYDVSFNHFVCRKCDAGATLYYDKDYVNLICPSCGHKYTFSQIRKRISRKDQEKEIGDLMEQGYVMTSPEEIKKFNPKFVCGATEEIRRKLIKIKKKENHSTSRKNNTKDDEILSLEEILNDIKTGVITPEE